MEGKQEAPKSCGGGVVLSLDLEVIGAIPSPPVKKVILINQRNTMHMLCRKLVHIKVKTKL